MSRLLRPFCQLEKPVSFIGGVFVPRTNIVLIVRLDSPCRAGCWGAAGAAARRPLPSWAMLGPGPGRLKGVPAGRCQPFQLWLPGGSVPALWKGLPPMSPQGCYEVRDWPCENVFCSQHRVGGCSRRGRVCGWAPSACDALGGCAPSHRRLWVVHVSHVLDDLEHTL